MTEQTKTTKQPKFIKLGIPDAYSFEGEVKHLTIDYDEYGIVGWQQGDADDDKVIEVLKAALETSMQNQSDL